MKIYPRTRREIPRKRWNLRKKIVLTAVAAVVALGVIWAIWNHGEIARWVTKAYSVIASWTTDHSRLTTGLLIAAAMIVAALALWKLPKLQAARSQGVSSRNRFDREDQARKTLAQVIGGIFVLAGLYSSIQTFNLQQEGQITDRYTKAIDQLGAVLPGDTGDAKGKPRVNLEVRLGGIYALERIAHDSPKDQGTIMEVLSAYVRENAPVVNSPEKNEVPQAVNRSVLSAIPEPRADIQAILTVIRRRDSSKDSNGFSIDLNHTDLRGAQLYGANLRGAQLYGANLRGAHLSGAVLLGAHLRGAVLNRADFRAADLTVADLSDTNLREADLSRAVLIAANLHRADLTGADLSGADLGGADLSRAVLIGANLYMADLTGADLSGADLGGADLKWVDLSDTLGVTQEQLDLACGSPFTRVQRGFHTPPSCNAARLQVAP